MSKYYVEPQEEAPQCFNGVDYSAPGRILVRTKDALLVWRKSGSVWSGIGQPHSYVATRLHVIPFSVEASRHYSTIGDRELLKGGRLSTARLLTVIEKIRQFMKMPKLDVKDIDPKKTYVVDIL